MISIIIPTYNEASTIADLVAFIKINTVNADIEIIVSDGGSTDATVELATKAGASALLSPDKGRAAQMNFGASIARGQILYFVHADCLPPKTFVTDIENAVSNKADAGRYRTSFMSSSLLLKLNAFFTRFNWFVCYGGDQTLFVTKALFETIGGFDETKLIMEDYDISIRIKQSGTYVILNNYVQVSVRKYEANSWWVVQRANYKAIQMYKAGASSEVIVTAYRKCIKP